MTGFARAPTKWVLAAHALLGLAASLGTIAASYHEEVRPKATCKGHAAPVTSLAFSGHGKTLASGSEDNSAKLWDGSTGRELLNLRGVTVGGVGAVALSNDGRLLATGGDSLTLWNLGTGEDLVTFPGLRGGVLNLVLSPDGKTVATEGPNEPAKLWDVESKQLRATLRGQRGTFGFLSGLAFSPDGKTLVTANVDDRIPKLWDVATGESLGSFRGDESVMTCVAFSPDGKTLATGTSSGSRVILWDVATRQQIAAMKHFCFILDVAFSADGKAVAAAGGVAKPGGSPQVVLWDVASGKEIGSFEPPRHLVSLQGGNTFTAQALSADATLWATACADNTIKIWDLGAVGTNRNE
jgi:WD40 repeat protein